MPKVLAPGTPFTCVRPLFNTAPFPTPRDRNRKGGNIYTMRQNCPPLHAMMFTHCTILILLRERIASALPRPPSRRPPLPRLPNADQENLHGLPVLPIDALPAQRGDRTHRLRRDGTQRHAVSPQADRGRRVGLLPAHTSAWAEVTAAGPASIELEVCFVLIIVQTHIS